MKRDQILAALPALKPVDLKAIRAAADTLLGDRASRVAARVENTPSGPLGWLYDGLMAATGLRLPYPQFVGTQAGKQFAKWGPMMIDFAEGAFAEPMAKKVSGLAIIRLLLDLIIADLKARKIPVTLGTISINMERVADVFSNAFPGYLEAGLTQLIASQMRRQ